MHEFRPGAPLVGLLLAALLAGCGQKGPLYLPQPQAKSPPSEQAPAPPSRP
ncbi:MAG: lipoprotein [Candidatus Competibacteraceae bacterium]|nr:lipoprotein [Candidatus Competibacteraceae bacterium]MBK7983050.1 lipoprotein [Candidatus Competibacteraceae bacterium]MBK8898397.1 lipoprotein [Candidatus Competibacteraceae bacterium]MBK8962207.1 lipoprotein [Candidatus Competibacteraceae bacterium]MBK9951423.1 lipoprotein [Candidatus Competibacteraceae bacterium]